MRQRQQQQQQNQTMIIWKKYRKCVENICAIANICAQTRSTHASAMRRTANTHRTKENQSVYVHMCVYHAVLRSVPFRFRFGWRANNVRMHFPLKIHPNGSFSMCVCTHSTMRTESVQARGGTVHTLSILRVNRRAWFFPAFSFTATFESSERRSAFRERVLLWLLPNAHSKINSVSIVRIVVSYNFVFLLSFVCMFTLFHRIILIFYRFCDCIVSAKAIRNNNWLHKRHTKKESASNTNVKSNRKAN